MSRKPRRLHAERDAEIYRLVAIKRRTLVSVGLIYGISGERVRGITIRFGDEKYFGPRPFGRAPRCGLKELRATERNECIQCGVTLDDHDVAWACTFPPRLRQIGGNAEAIA